MIKLSSLVAAAMRWVPIAMAVGTGLTCLWIARTCFPYFAFDPDSAAYLFQAKLFAAGKLAAAAPPEFGFSSSPHINIYNGLWFAKYPFGNSLFLAPGILLGLPSLMPAIATCLTLLLFFAIVRELFDQRVAVLALLIAAYSPATVLMGSTLLSQPTSRLFVALFFWSMLRSLSQSTARAAMLYGAVAGFALGYAFNTRPLVAVVCGVASLVLLVRGAVQAPQRQRIIPPMLAAGASLLVMIGLFFAWNAYLTGDPLLLPYHALQRADRMGFGLRGEGYAPLISDFRIDFTPWIALNRIWQHTLAALLYSATGWGTYVSSMFLFSHPAHVFPATGPLLLVPVVLVGVALARPAGRFAELFCGSVFLLTLIALFFQYSDHATWGSTPLHSSYYSEAALFGLTPLIARGMLLLYDAARRTGRALPWAVVAGCIGLFGNAVYTNNELLRYFRNWDPHYQLLPRLVENAGLHNAVIFVPNSRNAPVGDFPFKPLDRADVVYFRTGPLPQWRLDTPDWRLAYARYFAGRSAYVFDQRKLEKLDTPAAMGGN